MRVSSCFHVFHCACHVQVMFDSQLPCSECTQPHRHNSNECCTPGFRWIQHEKPHRAPPCPPSLTRHTPSLPSPLIFVCAMVLFAPTWTCPHLKYGTQKRQSIRKFRCPATPSEVKLQSKNCFPVAIDKHGIIISLGTQHMGQIMHVPSSL